jgi:hypothetical protein
MTKRYFRPLLAGAAILLLATAARATPITLVTTLTGAQEVAPTGSPGIGIAVVVIDSATHLLDVSVTFSGLLSPTMASHIHCCGPAGTNQMVATAVPTFPGFPLSVTSGTYHNAFDMSLLSTWNPAFVTAHGGTAATAELAFVMGVLAGQAYLNIHTVQFGTGEIRGQLRVPEPDTLALLSVGLLALGFLRRRVKL